MAWLVSDSPAPDISSVIINNAPADDPMVLMPSPLMLDQTLWIEAVDVSKYAGASIASMIVDIS